MQQSPIYKECTTLQTDAGQGSKRQRLNMAIDQGGPDAGPLASTDYHRVSARVLEIANKLRALGVDSVLQVRD